MDILLIQDKCENDMKHIIDTDDIVEISSYLNVFRSPLLDEIFFAIGCSIVYSANAAPCIIAGILLNGIPQSKTTWGWK